MEQMKEMPHRDRQYRDRTDEFEHEGSQYHSYNHYVYARMNGVVPPSSRR